MTKYSSRSFPEQQQQTNILPIEVGCQGFVATSTISLLWKMGVKGCFLQKATKSAEISSKWLWMKRKDPNWAPR